MKFQKILLFLPFLLQIVSGDYADGQLRVGDTYNSPIKSNDAYSIFQLPSGASLEGITCNETSIGTFMINFYVCPQDYLCTTKEGSELIIKMDLNDIKILSKKELKTSTHFNDDKVIPFHPDARGDVYVLGEGRFIYKINLEDSQVVDRFPHKGGGFEPSEKEEQKIVRGEIDEVNDRMFLSLQNSTIIKLSLIDFEKDSVVPLSQLIQSSSIQKYFAINKKTSYLYVAARFVDQTEKDRCRIFESKEEFINAEKERFSSEIPQPAENLRSLFTDDDSKYLYALFVDSKTDKELKKQMTLYQIDTWTLNITGQASFPSMEYVGNFFAKRKDYLYIFTSGGELIRFSVRDNSLKWDKMTFVMVGHDKRSYDPNFMPTLMSAKVFDDDIAYLGGKSGIFIKANLTNFCSDEFECDPFPKWTFALIGIIFACTIIVGIGWWFINYQFQKRKAYRSRILINDLMREHDRNASFPSSPVSKREYGAINDNNDF